MYQLRYTNPYGEIYYLANLGEQWPHRPEKRLVERTVKDPKRAKKFKTEEDANATLVVIGQGAGWEAVEVAP